MDQERNKSETTPGIALAAIILGTVSVVIIVAGVITGVLVEAVGMTSFITPTILLGCGAVICGVMGKSRIPTGSKKALRMAKIGLVTGAVAVLAAALLRVAVLIFFIPWLIGG